MRKNERTLEEEIEIYKKINETIYMIISVTRAKKRCDNITISLLNDKILKNIEDLAKVQYSFPYRYNIGNIVKLNKEIEKYLLKKCEGNKEKYDEVLYTDTLEYEITENEKENGSYDLLSMYTTDAFAWWHKLLKSNIDIKKRSNMYIDILINSFSTTLFISSMDDWEKETHNEILNYINEANEIEEKETESYKNQIARRILNNDERLLTILQEGKYINFSNVKIDGIPITKILWMDDHRFDTFKVFYNELSEAEKKETINWMLKNSPCDLYKIRNILDLDFKLDKHFINDLTNKVLKNIDDKTINENTKKIAKKIVSKASNPEEKRKYTRYANEFLEKTDYQKILDERQKEKEQLRQQELLLDEKREELSTLLYNLNDKLQEEYPGKMKLKNIDFKKQS